MRSKSVVVAAIGLAVFIAGPSAGIADTQTGFYLARSPGSVRYLSLEGSGHDVTGFLEEIVIDQSGSDGEVRTQTSARRSANSISFDTYTATRNAHGYMLTSVTRSGRIVQRQFIQTSVPAINASVDALRVDADRIRARADIVSAKNQLTKYAAMSSLDAARLTTAQARFEAASLSLGNAQRSADRLSALARIARTLANAAVDQPGVSLEENRNRIGALTDADEAEQNAVSAQRASVLAANAVDIASADVVQLRSRLIESTERAHTLNTRLASNDAIGP
jgi:hypothetical protein